MFDHDTAEDLLETLPETYNIYVINPAENNAVGYSIYYKHAPNFETQMLSNNGGLTSYSSVSPEIGGEWRLKPDERFFNAIGYGYHSVMSMMSQTDHERLRRDIDNTIEMFYENTAGINQVSDVERWLIHQIVVDATHRPKDDPAGPEFAPIYAYIDACTAFDAPTTYDMPEYPENTK